MVEFCEESVEETVKVREYTLPTDKEKGGRRKLRGSFEIDFRDELGFGFEEEEELELEAEIEMERREGVGSVVETDKATGVSEFE